MLQDIIRIAKEAGKLYVNASNDLSVSEKSKFNDFVTQYDVKVQEYVVSELKKICPDAHFLGEEEHLIEGNLDKGDCFIIDPIDGTTNFVKGLLQSTTSIAHTKDGELVDGVVYNPYVDVVFYAHKGEGAYANGKRIHVTDRSINESVVALGTSPYQSELCDRTMQIAIKVLKNSLDIRRGGTAAYDLSFIAKGGYGLFFELALSPWDFAGAMMIVKEAGGKVVDFDGNEPSPYKKSSIIAGTDKTISEFFEIIKGM